MLARAERLADPAFFLNRFRYQNRLLAELPVSVGLAHALLLDETANRVYCSCPAHPKPCLHAQAFEAPCARWRF